MRCEVKTNGRKKRNELKLTKAKPKIRDVRLHLRGDGKLFAGFGEWQEQECLLFSFKKDKFHNRILARKLLEKFNFLQSTDSSRMSSAADSFYVGTSNFQLIQITLKHKVQIMDEPILIYLVFLLFFSFSRDIILRLCILMHVCA